MNHKITLKEIKDFLQDNSNVPDIGIKDSTRLFSDLRKSYCALASAFTTFSLDKIGTTLRPDFRHDAVLYNIDKFNQVYPTGTLECEELHNKAFRHFSEINGSFPLTTSNVEQIKKSYNIAMNKAIHKFFIAVEKRDAKIESLTAENKKLKYKISVFNKTIFGRI
jgi:hypothetical protein